MNIEFYIQASAPRSLVRSVGDVETIGQAVEQAFPLHAEAAFLNWHGHSIRLGYKYDISECIEQIVAMLGAIEAKATGDTVVQFASSGFFCEWSLAWSAEEVDIDADWQVVQCDALEALRCNRTLRMMKDDFLREWKPLLGRVLVALDAQAAFVPKLAELRSVYMKLRRAVAPLKIPVPGSSERQLAGAS